MNSTIQVRSIPQQGSTFWFDVPLPVGEKATHTSLETDNREVVGYQGKIRRILVADSRWENRTVFTNLLQPLGFEVVEAADEKTVWQKAQELPPDLLITDTSVSLQNEFDWIQKLRQSPEFATVPIMVSSANVFASDRDRFCQAGSDDFLPKPVDFSDFLQKLDNHLHLQWIYQESSTEPASDSGETDSSSEENIALPPIHELKYLQEQTRKGSLRKIEKYARRLQDSHPDLADFSQKVVRLASRFPEAELLEFLQTCLDKCAVD